MTWRPSPQPPCEPDCTCGTAETPAPAVTRDPGPLRECGVTGCGHCREVAQWIEDTDPDPVPGGGDRLPNSTYRKATT